MEHYSNQFITDNIAGHLVFDATNSSNPDMSARYAAGNNYGLLKIKDKLYCLPEDYDPHLTINKLKEFE